MNNTKKNVIIYCRVSTDKQAKTGESLDLQEEQCRAYCKRNDYQVLAVFSEQFTGTKDKRPKVEEALDFIKHSELKIDYVIVLKIDRVSRGGIVIHDSFKKKFQDLGVSLKDTHGVIGEDRNVVEIEGINTDKYNWAKSNTNQIAENVTVMMSENERNTILQRMIGQAIKNNQRGYKVRNSEFGYQNKRVMTEFGKKTIQVENPEESVYIKKMFELKARGDLNYRDIVRQINLMGYKSRSRIKWNSQKTQAIGSAGGIPLDIRGLQRYLGHTIYAGVMCEEWTGYKAIKTPYSGIISVDLWNRANRGKCKINILNNDSIEIEYFQAKDNQELTNIQKHRNYNPEYPFGKVLKCPICQGHLTADRAKSKSGKYHYYYSCRGKLGSEQHKNYYLRRDKTNQTIINLFTKMKFDDKAIEIFERLSESVFNSRQEEYLEQSKFIHKNIEELEYKKRNILEHIGNIINFPDLLESQNEELQKIKLELTKLKNITPSSGEKIGLERFKECSKKLLKHLDKYAIQSENPEIIQLVFDIVFGGKMQYDELMLQTPLNKQLLALENKKDFQEIGKSNQNHKWWTTNLEFQTIYNQIVNMVDKVDKVEEWQSLIQKLNSQS